MNFFEARFTRKIQENSDSYSFVMEIPDGFSWKAGQHALFRLTDREVAEGDRDSRVFTIASAPEDGCLMFTTRIAEPHSSYKEQLLRGLAPGDVLLVAPALGDFDLHFEKERSLIVAGGIGITPARSLLRHYSEQGAGEHLVSVFYSDNRGEYVYGDFWKETERKMPGLEIRLFSDQDEFTNRVKTYAAEHGNAAEYLIAGSPGMNSFFTKLLGELGIEKENLLTDNFMGY
ncbi:ferredoxin--NADP reductase [Lachnoclostridium sp. Marseille-P6806]|uniref:ferredoxin--NADP reductase n=1 Tax=Lachnoclostridium sp. Marseille-P6806 TaxID=2364793 RepID=UPI001031264C|nr:FAD-dependent oxidoreductase [Lachnoclostridium sp. Marseille-P6806]